MFRPTRLAVAMLLTAAGACRDATGPDDQLAAARARWAEHGPQTYAVTVVRGCECLPAMSGPVVVTVVQGEVTSRAYTPTGEPVAPSYAENFPSVEQLFERIREARRANVVRLEVTYDPALGHPVRVFIDRDAITADDEVTYLASDLRAVF
jgi:hypothetical protein